jgi:hypothetical protein
VGRERDAVTRAFYDYAQGDPNSYPVGMAVLLTACSRKMATLPRNLRDSSVEFRGMAHEVTRMQQELLEKLRASHTQVLGNFKDESSRVIAVFKDENARANDIWRQTMQELIRLLEGAKAINQEFNPILTSARQIGQEVQTLKGSFDHHMLAAQQIMQGVEVLKGLHREAKTMHGENQSLVSQLTNDARANWLTLGFLAGILLAATFSYMAWWGVALSVVAVIALFQLAFRRIKT